MAIKNNARLEIYSTIEDLLPNGTAEGEPETIHECLDAMLCIDENEATIQYKTDTDSGCVVSTFIYGRSGTLTVRRQGAISSVMEFSQGKTFKSFYEIAPYKFDMTVRTERIEGAFSETGTSISFTYTMEIGGAVRRTNMTLKAEVYAS